MKDKQRYMQSQKIKLNLEIIMHKAKLWQNLCILKH